MNGVIINIFADMSESDYFEEELVKYRHLPVACEIIERDKLVRFQMNVAAVEYTFIDVRIIIFNNGDYEDVIIGHEHIDHISTVASNKY